MFPVNVMRSYVIILDPVLSLLDLRLCIKDDLKLIFWISGDWQKRAGIAPEWREKTKSQQNGGLMATFRLRCKPRFPPWVDYVLFPYGSNQMGNFTFTVCDIFESLTICESFTYSLLPYLHYMQNSLTQIQFD